MVERLGSLITALKECVASLEPAALSGEEAAGLFAVFAEVERLGAAGKLIAGERVAATEVWRRGGSRSLADWAARHSGTDVSRATEALETARGLGGCEVVAGELRAGRLSVPQAHAILDAAAVRPDAEERLVHLAREASLRHLREECRRVKNAAASAAGAHDELHARRSFRNWTGRDGAVCFQGRLTPEAGAELIAAVEARSAVHAKAARGEGRREPFEAYAADALVELVTEDRGAGAGSAATRPQATVIVHVAYEALLRGGPADGEMCEIQGVGPVPVDVIRRLAADSILRVLVTKGAQPTAVTPGVRTIPRALRLLIEARDRTCVVPGCDVTRGRQVDHRRPFSVLGPTDLDNCALLCKRHHDMKTYQGYILRRDGTGAWTFRPPDDYFLGPARPDPTLGPLVGAATSGTGP